MQQRRIGMHIISAWPEQGMKAVSKAQVPTNEWVHVTVTYDGSRKASGIQIFINGAVQEKNVENDKFDGSTIRTEVPWKIGSRSVSEPFTGSIQNLRIQRRVLSAAEVDSLAKLSQFQVTLAKAVDQRTADESNELYNFWLKKFDTAFTELTASLAAFEKEEADIRARGTIAHVMHEKNDPATAFVLFRGEYDQRRDQVTPETPSAFPQFPKDAPRNRLGFAEWLLGAEHPLTARVTVNRLWQEIFGTGLVRTTGDLGVSGEIPINQVTGGPCLGSWTSYGLGSLNENLPSFVVMVARPTNQEQVQAISARLWSSGYLPGEYAATSFRSSGDPILFINNPGGVPSNVRRTTLDGLNRLNQLNFDQVGDPEIQTRIAQYELAYRMQSSVPELTDLASEPASTYELYGDEAKKPGTLANTILLARRMVERGVRFVQIYHNNWDSHANVAGRLPDQCRDLDQATYGLITDLKQRGMLDETLIIWGGEFGRTIYSQGGLSKENYGRDHHPRCFTMQ